MSGGESGVGGGFPRTVPGSGRHAARSVGVLDVGTSKVVCLIAAVAPRAGVHAGVPRAEVLGAGHVRARGIKAGVVTDLDEAEGAIRAAIGEAERMAGLALEEIHVAVSCGRLKSRHFTASAEVESGVVDDGDIARVMSGGRAYADRDGRTLVHLNLLGFRLDRAQAVTDPRGMAAGLLSADLHAVTADDAPLRNLTMAVERCHVAVAGLVAAPFASALAASTDDERRLGVTVVDIGAGVATLAGFADGQLVFADAVPVGGHHITYDIARALNMPLAEAERIKALYGTLIEAGSDNYESFEYALAGPSTGGEDGGEEDLVGRVTRAQLRSVVRPRVEATLALIAERLERAVQLGPVTRLATGRVVLTGGASQLAGLGDLASGALARPVRVAGVTGLAGLPAGLARPGFAVAAGLLSSCSRPSLQVPAWRTGGDGQGGGYLGRVGNWLREGF